MKSPYVDLLAHPGYITARVAELAARNNVFIEITTRRGHNATNSHVAEVAGKAKALMLLNSDTHDEGDLLTESLARDTLDQAGINARKYKQIMEFNPLKLLQRIRRLP